MVNLCLTYWIKMSKMRTNIWSRSLWSNRLLFSKCLRLSRLLWPKNSLTPQHRCRSLSLGQEAIFVCAKRVILLLSGLELREVPELPAKFQESPRTQVNPRQHSYFISRISLLTHMKMAFWPRPRDRQRWHCTATGSAGCEGIDFFGQKSL